MGFFDLFRKQQVAQVERIVPTISVEDCNSNPAAYGGQTTFDNAQWSIYDGGKFDGGFGATQVQHIDYWTLRARSSQLFNENLYAKGLIRRLITNEINTGLVPEAFPDEEVLGLPNESLRDWTESTENRFMLWGKSPNVCDFKHERTWGKIQREARLEALISGDVLVTLRQQPATRLPAIDLISGNLIRTPLGAKHKVRQGHEIKHGIEFNRSGRQVAYWILQDDGGYKRLPAFGEKSGRRLAWMVYGTEKRLDEVRGQPLLAVVLQSIKEVDRYRDSVQRKATVNSIVAAFVKKTQDKPGTLPMTGGAVRRDQVSVTDNTAAAAPRTFNINQYLPSVVIDELQVGEEIVMKGGEGTDTNFAEFEAAIVHAIAWANEVPPEILTLAFSNNYSASQAAINEFKIYLNKIWSEFGETFCAPIYCEWLISEALLGAENGIAILDAWRDPSKHAQLASWCSADWYGSIKPSTDMVKQAKGSEILVKRMWSTNTREARVLTGTSYTHNAKRVKQEVLMLIDAMQPLIDLQEKGVDLTALTGLMSSPEMIGDEPQEAEQ
jgi:capsid protein